MKKLQVDARWLIICLLTVIIAILILRKPSQSHYHQHIHPGVPTANEEVHSSTAEDQETDSGIANNASQRPQASSELRRDVPQPMAVRATKVD